MPQQCFIIMELMQRNSRAILAGFAESNYPADIIQQKFLEAKRLLSDIGIEIVYDELFDEQMRGEKIINACNRMSGKEPFDLLILCIVGWVPSDIVIQVASFLSHKPMILWGLTGDIRNGKIITPAAQAGTTALRKTMEDLGYRFKYVYECLGSRPKIDRINDFARAARAASLLKRSKIGMMGYRDMNLYSTMFDGISLKKNIGVEIEFFDALEIIQRMGSISDDEILNVINKIKNNWIFEGEPDEDFLKKGVKIYLALRDIIRERGYQGISLKDVEGMRRLLNVPPAMVFMLISDELGICTIPENDALGAVTELMIRYVTGQIAAYMEIYEFLEDSVLLGVPDYVPSEIVQAGTRVMVAGFGKLGKGIVNVSKIKKGRVILTRLSNYKDRYVMHIITGEARQPPSWEEAGWSPTAPQLPSILFKPDCPVDVLADKVLSQHYILSYGDNVDVIKDLCKILNIEVI